MTLNKPNILGRIERCAYDDFPSISLTRDHIDGTGKTIYITKDFSKLLFQLKFKEMSIARLGDLEMPYLKL